MENKPRHKHNHFTIKQTIALTFLALLGFLAGTFVVLKGNNIFHELEYDPGAVTDIILKSYETGPNKLHVVSDTSRQMEDTVKEEIAFRRKLLTELSDSAKEKLLFDHQLFIDKEHFDDSCLIKYESKDTTQATAPSILWKYCFNHSLKYGRPLPPVCLHEKVRAMSLSYTINMDFLTAYPGFVLWVFLIILQFSLFSVLPVIIWMVIKNFKARLPEIYNHPEHRWLTVKYAWLAFMIILLFVLASYFAFFDPNLIRNELFYKRMNSILITVGVLTSITGVSCFTGYMLISGTPVRDDDENEVSEPEIKVFNEMNTLFTNLLTISSIVLCIIVLTTGTLYTSINDMEFIEKITADMGYTPFSYHYVLLIGILCTVLLLFFFIPAKIRLDQMEKRIKKADPDNKQLAKTTDIYGMLKSGFVVGLPIITGIVHFLVNILWHK